ncbi:ABC transporter permease [Actinocorallia aurantiaca]|uniref:ABC transporter permease n=1 Tax=Actinocorallia aurantiaca TaxID=46204 RepID=A0ABN3U451_9ACTN
MTTPTLPEARWKAWRPARPALLAAWTVIALIVLAAAFPGLFTGRDPLELEPAVAMRGPSPEHWFGTDQLGRDLFTRVVYGTRPSLLVGLGALTLALAAGALYGLAAALLGRFADVALMRLLDVLLALPQLLVALLALTVLGSGQVNLMIAIALSLLPAYARLVRAEALVVRRSGYLESAVLLGQHPLVQAFRHVLPNALGPLLVLGTVGFGMAVIAASGLSFLGFGAEPPSPEWGVMLSEGRDYLQTAWWLGVFPGAAITLTVVAVSVAGRSAQARFTRRTTL